MSSTNNSRVLDLILLDNCASFEKLLREKYGATGNGLWKLIDSVSKKHKFPKDVVTALGFIGKKRNAVFHKEQDCLSEHDRKFVIINFETASPYFGIPFNNPYFDKKAERKKEEKIRKEKLRKVEAERKRQAEQRILEEQRRREAQKKREREAEYISQQKLQKEKKAEKQAQKKNDKQKRKENENTVIIKSDKEKYIQVWKQLRAKERSKYGVTLFSESESTIRYSDVKNSFFLSLMFAGIATFGYILTGPAFVNKIITTVFCSLLGSPDLASLSTTKIVVYVLIFIFALFITTVFPIITFYTFRQAFPEFGISKRFATTLAVRNYFIYLLTIMIPIVVVNMISRVF